MRRTIITLATALVATVALAGQAAAAPKFVAGPPPPGCPPGWIQATPPLNPALGCVPTFLRSAVTPTRSAACPAGWERARRPLNARLGCLPGFVAGYAARRKTPSRGCRPHWAKASAALNDALRCVPAFEASAVGGGERTAPPAACPPQWRRARAPLNPALRCVPGFLTSDQGSAKYTGYCWFGWAHPPGDHGGACVPQIILAAQAWSWHPIDRCPSGWTQSAPPLNPALRCVPGFVVSALAPR